MNSKFDQGKRVLVGWWMHLLRMRVALTAAERWEEQPSGSDSTWPARLIHAGVVMMAAGVLMVVQYLRLHHGR